MAYEVLYRKYRPKDFTEVTGQDHVVSILADQAKAGTFAHAYLFSGSRGTGKTSVARIFARALGCTDKDLYEIDAASNTGVDDVRELRDGVRTLPFESPVKVYLIDEVHMLSKSAFNALLKTLEEPPAHVIFILATTELHKVPDTVISRCQAFVFRRPSAEILAETVKKVAKKEGVKIDAEASRLVAFLGDGSFRDTLGILQKVLAAASDRDVTPVLVEEVTGSPELSQIHDFLFSLMSGEAETALRITDQAAAAGRDMKIFVRRMIDELRLAMLLKYAPEVRTEVEGLADAERMEFFGRLNALPQAGKVSAVLKELLDCYDRTGTTYLPQLPLELAVVEICQKLSSPQK